MSASSENEKTENRSCREFTASATEEHHPTRGPVVKSVATFDGSAAGSGAGEAKRTSGLSDTMSNTPPTSIGRAAVGFDIETTGIGNDDIVTVACVWSPFKTATCFYGDDFTPVLEMLDKASLIYTFNGIEFDLPRLAKHCGRSGIGQWVCKTVDPHYLMRHAMGFGGCMRLNDLLVANGYEPKSGSGLQAIQFWNEGNRAALSSYCMDDSRLTYELCETRSIKWGSIWRIHLWESSVMQFQKAAGGI
jgi:hypothetical protein